jgi:ABC-type sulfate transport system permease component
MARACWQKSVPVPLPREMWVPNHFQWWCYSTHTCTVNWCLFVSAHFIRVVWWRLDQVWNASWPFWMHPGVLGAIRLTVSSVVFILERYTGVWEVWWPLW